MIYATQRPEDRESEWMCGPGVECRAADVLLEGHIGPPLWVKYNRGKGYRVESTHTLTESWGVREDGLRYRMHTYRHPRGIGERAEERALRERLEGMVKWEAGHRNGLGRALAGWRQA